MAKGCVFYGALEFLTSFKISNGEGGQNGEVVKVSIDLKGFILGNLIMGNYGPNKNVKSIPMTFGIF